MRDTTVGAAEADKQRDHEVSPAGARCSLPIVVKEERRGVLKSRNKRGSQVRVLQMTALRSDGTPLARRIYKRSHLTGEFQLRSGATSNEYFDKYLFESDPRQAPLAEEVAAALDATDKDVEIGGAGLASAAIDLGLVDELRMFRNPVLVGGTPLLPPVTKHVPLDLVETRTFGSRVIYERYGRARDESD